MLRRLALLVFAIAFAVTPIAVGCGSDDDTTGPGDSTADFSGSWDLQLTVTATGCDGGAIGDMMDLCVTIQVDGNTLFIEDEDGRIEGVGNGNSATLSRTNQDESMEVELTLSGSSLIGTVTIFDFGGQCETTASLAGSKRTSPCPPPGDFAGYWEMTITVASSECVDEQVGDFFFACMSVSVDGSNITIDDDSSEGPLTGEIEGNRAVLMRTSQDGTLTVELTLEGDVVTGTATMNYSSGNCAGASVEYSIAGTRRSSPCGSGSGGPFEGYWNITGEFTANQCNFDPFDPGCDRIIQDGNTLYILGSEITATASGNTVTFFEIEEFEGIRITIEGELTLAGDGNSFTGTQSITLEEIATQVSCTSSVDIVGTRTDECTALRANTLGLVVPKGQ